MICAKTMTQEKQKKLDKRANALRDNLKRRKLKDKESRQTTQTQSELPENTIKKQD